MISLRAILFAAPVISGILIGAPKEVAAKCSEVTTPTMRGTALVIDGRWVAEVDSAVDLYDQTPMWERFALVSSEAANLQPGEILDMNIRCLNVPNPATGGRGTQEAIMVVTVNALEDSLSRLSAMQESYRASTGHYAANYSELPGFPLLHGVQGGTLTSTATGWTSSFWHGTNRSVTCHLAVGDPELLLPGQTLGQIHCVNTRTTGA
jgi:hypothetical protein